MTENGGFPVRETLAAEEAFRLFSHELRTGILLALWNAPEFRLSFSELQDEVGERDSGKFNYHLSKLVGQFVGHVDDEYELLYPGHRVIDAIRSGMLHRSAEIEPIDVSGECPACESSLEFEYSEYIVAISCSECDEPVLEFAFDPAGVVDRTPEEIVAAFDERTRSLWRLALAGVCPVCSGDVRIEPSKTAGRSADIEHFGDTHPVVASLDCRQCSFYSFPPVGTALLAETDFVCTLSREGVDVHERRLWELDFIVDPSRTSVQSDDPWEIEISTGIGDGERRITLDEDLAVRSVDSDIDET